MPSSKLLTLSEAISLFVPDGSAVVMGTALESFIPFAAGHEIMRQRKRNLTLIGPISDILFDQIVGAGCVRRVRAAWVGNVITGSGYNFRRAVESGGPTGSGKTARAASVSRSSASLNTTVTILDGGSAGLPGLGSMKRNWIS